MKDITNQHLMIKHCIVRKENIDPLEKNIEEIKRSVDQSLYEIVVNTNQELTQSNEKLRERLNEVEQEKVSCCKKLIEEKSNLARLHLRDKEVLEKQRFNIKNYKGDIEQLRTENGDLKEKAQIRDEAVNELMKKIDEKAKEQQQTVDKLLNKVNEQSKNQQKSPEFYIGLGLGIGLGLSAAVGIGAYFYCRSKNNKVANTTISEGAQNLVTSIVSEPNLETIPSLASSPAALNNVSTWLGSIKERAVNLMWNPNSPSR